MAELLHEKKARAGALRWLAIGIVCATLALTCALIPMYVIRPFRPQGDTALRVALWIHDVGPWITGLCAALIAGLTAWTWYEVKGGLPKRTAYRCAMLVLCFLAVAGAVFTHVNIYEKMFHPYETLAFEPADSIKIDAKDKVLALQVGRHSRAYPILTMGYHHIVNDTVDGVPVAMTYCTLCHTGIAYDPVIDGRRLHFRLAGINNGNALMRDEETKTVWQQSTGEAIFGPLKGQHLKLIHSDEMSFALWRREQPGGDVLKPDAAWEKEYDGRDWEAQVEKTPAMVDTKASGIGPHRLMLGVEVGGRYKAYPLDRVLGTKFIQDTVADAPVLVVVGVDGESIRVFNPENLTFTPGSEGGLIRDAETGSGWNFRGCAVQGELSGRCLKVIDANKDYWFDWMHQHPGTAVYKG